MTTQIGTKDQKEHSLGHFFSDRLQNSLDIQIDSNYISRLFGLPSSSVSFDVRDGGLSLSWRWSIWGSCSVPLWARAVVAACAAWCVPIAYAIDSETLAAIKGGEYLVFHYCTGSGYNCDVCRPWGAGTSIDCADAEAESKCYSPSIFNCDYSESYDCTICVVFPQPNCAGMPVPGGPREILKCLK